MTKQDRPPESVHLREFARCLRCGVRGRVHMTVGVSNGKTWRHLKCAACGAEEHEKR